MARQWKECQRRGNQLLKRAHLDSILTSKDYRSENYQKKLKVSCPNPTLQWYMRSSSWLWLYWIQSPIWIVGVTDPPILHNLHWARMCTQIMIYRKTRGTTSIISMHRKNLLRTSPSRIRNSTKVKRLFKKISLSRTHPHLPCNYFRRNGPRPAPQIVNFNS